MEMGIYFLSFFNYNFFFDFIHYDCIDGFVLLLVIIC